MYGQLDHFQLDYIFNLTISHFLPPRNCGLYVLRVVDAILQAIREEGLMDEMW
jgi:hypothetical protein